MLAHSNKRPFVRNTILASLSLPDLAALGEFLEPIVLRERMIVQELKKRVEHIYFIESGVISLRIVSAGSMLETAVIGNRGAVGAAFLLVGHLPTHQSVVLFPGSALRIPTDDLRRVMNEHPKIRDHLSRYIQAFVLHSGQTGLCGVRHICEQRLASWLCLTCDAMDSLVLPVTHDYLATVLGLRRASVTKALIRFEEKGLIRKTRGVLHIDDRRRLELETCSCYGIIASGYTSSECLMHAD